MNVLNVCLQFGSLNIIMRNVCFKATNGSGPADLAELLHVYNPSRTLCSSSDTRMLKKPVMQMEDWWLSQFLLLWTPHLEFTPTGP